MMAGAMTVPFHVVDVKVDKSDRGVIRYRLDGFDPKKHSSNASLNNKTLVVTATKGPSNYKSEIYDLDISSAEHKPKSDTIEVHVKKNSNFKLDDAIKKKK